MKDRVFNYQDTIFFKGIPFRCNVSSTIYLPDEQPENWERLGSEQMQELIGDGVKPLSVGYNIELNKTEE
jgi:hypothetical protein